MHVLAIIGTKAGSLGKEGADVDNFAGTAPNYVFIVMNSVIYISDHRIKVFCLTFSW